MRLNGFVILAIVLFGGSAWAEENSARKLIDAAIVAHGGAAALAKYSVVTVKTEGIFQGYKDKPVFFHKDELTTHGANQYRSEMRFELNGAKVHVVNVLDGKQGWIKQSAVPRSGEQIVTTQQCKSDQLAKFQWSGHISHLTTLVPLKGLDYTLSLAGEQPAFQSTLVGVRVSHQGHRDVILYFDKETHLLRKVTHRGTAGTDDEGTVETRFGRYEEIEGIQMPTSWEVWLNNKCLWSHHVVERKFAETPAPGTFAKP